MIKRATNSLAKAYCINSAVLRKPGPTFQMRFFARPLLDMRLKELEPEEQLTFVRSSPTLVQIKKRAANDGLFPPIKAVEDMTESDIPLLIKEKKFDTLKELIDLKLQQDDSQMTDSLIA